MTKFFKVLMPFLLIFTILLSVIDFCCFDRNFYAKEYREIGTAEYIGVSDEDLDNMTDVLLGYLRKDYSTLDVEANVKGINRQVFNEKERLHMVDVKDLYLGAMSVRNVALVLTIAILIYLIVNKISLKDLYTGYKNALLIWSVVFAVLGIAIAIDFDKFWRFFHTIFFDNDLWLLSMRTDILLMMVPGKFFNDLCVRIVVMSLAIIFALFAILFLLNRKVQHEN